MKRNQRTPWDYHEITCFIDGSLNPPPAGTYNGYLRFITDPVTGTCSTEETNEPDPRNEHERVEPTLFPQSGTRMYLLRPPRQKTETHLLVLSGSEATLVPVHELNPDRYPPAEPVTPDPVQGVCEVYEGHFRTFQNATHLCADPVPSTASPQANGSVRLIRHLDPRPQDTNYRYYRFYKYGKPPYPANEKILLTALRLHAIRLVRATIQEHELPFQPIELLVPNLPDALERFLIEMIPISHPHGRWESFPATLMPIRYHETATEEPTE